MALDANEQIDNGALMSIGHQVLQTGKQLNGIGGSPTLIH